MPVQRVSCIEEDIWLRQTTVPPYLKDSPAALMLLGYYPDGVGISATDPVMHTKKSKPTGECVRVSLSVCQSVCLCVCLCVSLPACSVFDGILP